MNSTEYLWRDICHYDDVMMMSLVQLESVVNASKNT